MPSFVHIEFCPADPWVPDEEVPEDGGADTAVDVMVEDDTIFAVKIPIPEYSDLVDREVAAYQSIGSSPGIIPTLTNTISFSIGTDLCESRGLFILPIEFLTLVFCQAQLLSLCDLVEVADRPEDRCDQAPRLRSQRSLAFMRKV